MKISSAKCILGSIIVCLCSLEISAQKYIDQNGTVVFEASEKLFEEVKASNTNVTAIFDAEKSEFASLALVKAFRFKNALMEEHFNENYAESDTYPKAIFKGKLLDFNVMEMTSKQMEATLSGTLTFHGRDKEVTSSASVQKINGNAINIKGEFIVSPQDFDIKIPKIVRNKIAKEVVVSFDFKLLKK